MNDLGEKFRSKVEMAQSSSIFPLSTQAALAAAMRGPQGRSAPYFEGLPNDVLRSIAIAQQFRHSLVGSSQMPGNTESSGSSPQFPEIPSLSTLYFEASRNPSSLLPTPREAEANSLTAIYSSNSNTLGSPDSIQYENRTERNNENGENIAYATESAAPSSSTTSQLNLIPSVLTSIGAHSTAFEPLNSTKSSDKRSSLSAFNVSKSLYEVEHDESQHQAQKHNQTYGNCFSGGNFPYDLLYNSHTVAESNIKPYTGKKSRKEKKASNSVSSNNEDGNSNSVSSSRKTSSLRAKKVATDASQSGHTPQQQQQLLSQLQKELLEDVNKNKTIKEISTLATSDGKLKAKSALKRHNREQPNSKDLAVQPASQQNSQQLSPKQQLEEEEEQQQQHNGDLYASNLLLNFFKAANHSPNSREKDSTSSSSQYNGDSGEAYVYASSSKLTGSSCERGAGSSSPAKSSTTSDELQSNTNGSGSGHPHTHTHKAKSNTNTTSESDSCSGNEEPGRKSSSSPSSMDDIPSATASASAPSTKERTGGNGKRKAPTASGDQDTGSDNNKSSDLTNNSQSISDVESTDSSTRFEIETTDNNKSKELKNSHFDGSRRHPNPNISEEGRGSEEERVLISVNASGNNNSTIVNNKKRNRGFQRSEEGDILSNGDTYYCTLDTLQSQGETIDSNARKKLVHRRRNSGGGSSSSPAPTPHRRSEHIEGGST